MKVGDHRRSTSVRFGNAGRASQFAPRSFSVPAVPSLSPDEIENQEFQRDQLKATELESQEKHGADSVPNQERLGVLQAKREAFWKQRMARAKSLPNPLDSFRKNTSPAEASSPPPVVQRVKSGEKNFIELVKKCIQVNSGLDVWDGGGGFFVAKSKKDDRDWDHLHILVEGNAISEILCTFNAEGDKQHTSAKIEVNEHGAIFDESSLDVPKTKEKLFKDLLVELKDALGSVIRDDFRDDDED